ncbi:contact-dependent growth inhibition system immunity protein [Xanthomonas sacchari]|uniref:contact-dependent growth inhibition system immunity protein n=1 Tax=Xanthomonas sacchari TaxID=56458 RepID=UPI0020C3BEFF|nr:contact-dependent growth inhibition system immunity protein [Xanthomonas sacchari]
MRTLIASALARFNGDFFCLTTMSQGILGFAEPDVLPIYLPANISDSELGIALRSSFAGSRKVSAEEFQRIFSSGIIQERSKDQDLWIIKNYGYKSRSAAYKKMDTCDVSMFEDEIEIQPTHKKSIDGFTVRKDKGPFAFCLPSNVSNAELGAALRKGFSYCTRG